VVFSYGMAFGIRSLAQRKMVEDGTGDWRLIPNSCVHGIPESHIHNLFFSAPVRALRRRREETAKRHDSDGVDGRLLGALNMRHAIV
jgi:hypothetical protein